jgi:SAM-dependent methyltransferase
LSEKQPSPPQAAQDIPVMDYEGSGYRHEFWEGQGREYEDQIERALLARLIPPTGGRIVEIGAGFGRLADLYTGYDQIILFDYSRTLLADAVARWGEDSRFVFAAGNIYHLPLASHTIDTLVMVRVMHHLADVPAALKQVARCLHPGSRAILEYANKRNLKAIGRWLLRRQAWSPFAPEPVEFVKLNFDFHPDWMDRQMASAHLIQERRFALSHFRLPLLKRRISAQSLVRLEERFMAPAGNYPLSPSVFVQARLQSGAASPSRAGEAGQDVGSLFCCPRCRAEPLRLVDAQTLSCTACGERYHQSNQIWDFKE